LKKYLPKQNNMKSEKNFSITPRVFCHEDTKAQSFTKMNAQLFFRFHINILFSVFFAVKIGYGMNGTYLFVKLCVFVPLWQKNNGAGRIFY